MKSVCSSARNVVFLHSSDPGPKGRGRYAILACLPFARLLVGDDCCVFTHADGTAVNVGKDPVPFIDDMLLRFKCACVEQHPGLPCGGIFGYISYDYGCKRLGRKCRQREPHFTVPGQMAEFLFFDTLAVCDMQTGECFVVCADLEDKGQEWCRGRVEEFVAFSSAGGGGGDAGTKGDDWVLERIDCDLSFEQYAGKLKRIREYIAAGDTYQVNFARLFTLECPQNAWNLYRGISKANPVPFGHFGRFEDGLEVLGFSMERFLRIEENKVLTVPIKGTASRGKTVSEDEKLRAELAGCGKNQSELVMIVDLLRNDLGRFCRSGSVEVESLFDVETYATVHHLTSSVSGVLDKQTGHAAAVFDAIPGGSITGAPKRRTVEIIDGLEPSNRGLYCGNFGYFGFNGVSDFNIMIRTIVKEGAKLFFKSGGGITHGSDIDGEYDETVHKVKGFFGDIHLKG